MKLQDLNKTYEDGISKEERKKEVSEQKKFLTKHGYAKSFLHETYLSFILMFQDIIEQWKEKRNGTPVILDDFKNTPEDIKKNEEAWNALLDKMYFLLEMMNTENKRYIKTYDIDNDKIRDDKLRSDAEARKYAKKEFFKLFEQYFYNFWD